MGLSAEREGSLTESQDPSGVAQARQEVCGASFPELVAPALCSARARRLSAEREPGPDSQVTT